MENINLLPPLVWDQVTVEVLKYKVFNFLNQ